MNKTATQKLALLAFIFASLMPSSAFAATNEKLSCSAYVAVVDGTREFEFLLTNKQPTAMQANIHIDMTTKFKGPKRELGHSAGQTYWAGELLRESRDRRKYANGLSNNELGDLLNIQADGLMFDSSGPANNGWVNIGFSSRRGALNRIYVDEFEFRLPPLGTKNTKGLKMIVIQILADDEKLFLLTYKVTQKEMDSLLSGPAPRVFIRTGFDETLLSEKNKQARALGAALIAGKKLSIQAVSSKGKLLLKLTQSAFDYTKAYHEMIALEPIAKQKAIKAMGGNAEDCSIAYL